MGVAPLRSSISLSVVLHALLFTAWAVLAGKQAAKNAGREWVQIELAPTVTKTQTKDDDTRRVVQTEAGRKVQTAPEKAQLGERNQVVDRETVSKTRAIQVGRATRPAPAPRPRASSAGQERVAPAPSLSQLGVPIVPRGSSERATAPEWRSADPSAPAAAADYIYGMKESDRTALNTREFVFYGYFQRIRQRLDRSWNTSLKDQLNRLYRTGRKLASDMDHQTRILVTLNGAGEVVRVQVLEESGTRDLDEAAVRAFNQAGPFPNPPRGIVDAQGLIRIRWDFVLRT
jgi:TonB family protein